MSKIYGKLFPAVIFFGFLFSAHAKTNTELAGDIVQISVPLTAFASSYLLDDKQGSKQFLKSAAATAAITHIVKRVVNKKRPNGGNHAFPSGHTSLAFSGAAFIHHRYGIEYAAPAYVAASFVGYSRIHANKHDIYDVVAGASLAIASSYFFSEPYKNVGLGANYVPSTNGGEYHLQASYAF